MTIRVCSMHCLALFLAIVAFFAGFGQPADSLSYNSNIQIGGQRKTGVFSQTSLRLSTTNQLERRKLILYNVSGYTYTNVNSNTIADDWDFRSILLYRSDSNARLLPAIAHNFHSNVLYRIRNSHRGIIGVRTIPFRKIPGFTFLVGGGVERSHYSGEVFVDSPRVSSRRNFAMGFANFSGKHILGKHQVGFRYNLSLVQSMREAKDYFLWLTTGISLPIRKNLSIGASYDFRYRNVHLVEIPQVNELLLVNLKVNFSS